MDGVVSSTAAEAAAGGTIVISDTLLRVKAATPEPGLIVRGLAYALLAGLQPPATPVEPSSVRALLASLAEATAKHAAAGILVRAALAAAVGRVVDGVWGVGGVGGGGASAGAGAGRGAAAAEAARLAAHPGATGELRAAAAALGAPPPPPSAAGGGGGSWAAAPPLLAAEDHAWQLSVAPDPATWTGYLSACILWCGGTGEI